jgi:hypothetical protein
MDGFLITFDHMGHGAMYTVTLTAEFPAKNQAEATNFALDLIATLLENDSIQSATLTKVENHLDVDEPILSINRGFNGYNNYPGRPI